MAKSINSHLTDQLIGPQASGQHHFQALAAFVSGLGSVKNVNQLCKQTASLVADLYDADQAILHLVSQASSGKKQNCLLAHVHQTHESVCLAQTHQSKYFPCSTKKKTQKKSPSSPSLCTCEQYQSLIAVPAIFQSSTCIGILEVAHGQADFFTSQDLNLLQALANCAAVQLANLHAIEAQQQQFNSFVRAVMNSVDARDAITPAYCRNVANYAAGIGQQLGLKPAQLESLRLAALLHDVGKISTPDHLLTKAGRLDTQEFEQVKKHASATRHILEAVAWTDAYGDVADVAACHHEKLDGSGYPQGLEGTDVPFKSRIIAVADIFHAVTQPRHYRPGMSLQVALSLLDQMTPHQLDIRCVDALRTFLGVGVHPTCAA